MGLLEGRQGPIEPWEIAHVYDKFDRFRKNAGFWVKQWEEIGPMEVPDNPLLVRQAEDNLRAIRQKVMRLRTLRTFAEEVAGERMGEVRPVAIDMHEEARQIKRSLQGLSEQRDPLISALNIHTSALSDIHPNVIADALPQVLTPEERENIAEPIQNLRIARDLLSSAPQAKSAEDSKFKEWLGGNNDLESRLIMVGDTFTHNLSVVMDTIIDMQGINHEAIATHLLEKIVTSTTLIAAFGKRTS